MTGYQKIKAGFEWNTEDEFKLQLFTSNRLKWEYAIGAEVKAWLNDRLLVRLEEQPAWLTDHNYSILPENFIEDSDMLMMVKKRNARSGRRRSSFGLIVLEQ